MHLSDINTPADLKQLQPGELQAVADELRSYIVNTLSTHPGHLASSLGTVELTVALHYVFNTPDDKLIWDVGHQAYAHKILTGRREAFSTEREVGVGCEQLRMVERGDCMEDVGDGGPAAVFAWRKALRKTVAVMPSVGRGTRPDRMCATACGAPRSLRR